MKIKFINLLLIMIIAVSGCKKISKEQFFVPTQTAIQELKAWYEKECSKSIPVSINSTKASYFHKFLLNWEETKYCQLENTFIIPMKPDKSGESNIVSSYLVIRKEGEGIVESYYGFVLSKNKKPDFSLAPLPAIDVPSEFTGTVIKYNIDGSMLSSVHYDNGTVNKEQGEISIKLSDAGNTQSIVPENCDGGPQVCIDWYWQTYENGVLIDEVYLYTTCNCQLIENGGGGSGNSGQTPEQQLEAFVSQGKAVDGPVTTTDLFNDGIIWERIYTWKIYDAMTWGVISWEKGTLEKKVYPNISLWEFINFQHVKFSEAGMNIGGTRTATFNAATINISPSKTRVHLEIGFTITSKVGAIAPLSMPYTSKTNINAPNNIVPAQL